MPPAQQITDSVFCDLEAARIGTIAAAVAFLFRTFESSEFNVTRCIDVDSIARAYVLPRGYDISEAT